MNAHVTLINNLFIHSFFQKQIRKSENIVMFSLTSRDAKRYVVRQIGDHIPNAAFYKEHFATDQKSLRHLVQKL